MTNPNRTDHDDYMDTLAIKVSKALDGEDIEKVASVCAMVIAHALHEALNREEMLQWLNNFIHYIWEANERGPTH